MKFYIKWIKKPCRDILFQYLRIFWHGRLNNVSVTDKDSIFYNCYCQDQVQVVSALSTFGLDPEDHHPVAWRGGRRGHLPRAPAGRGRQNGSSIMQCMWCSFLCAKKHGEQFNSCVLRFFGCWICRWRMCEQKNKTEIKGQKLRHSPGARNPRYATVAINYHVEQHSSGLSLDSRNISEWDKTTSSTSYYLHPDLQVCVSSAPAQKPSKKHSLDALTASIARDDPVSCSWIRPTMTLSWSR